MTEFFDIHTHILPGVDDGAKDTQQALAMLRMAWDEGTRAVVLTPHYRGEYRKNTPQQLQERFAAFSAEAAQALPGLKLYLGQEICGTPGAPEALADGRALSMHGTGFVLLELPTKATREFVCKRMEALRFYGYRPIIAHAERCRILRRSGALLAQLLDEGVLIQLNADGVLGKYGWGAKRFCHRLLKRGLADFVASDAHNTDSRPPALQKCYDHIAKKYGGDYAAMLFHDNAVKILESI